MLEYCKGLLAQSCLTLCDPMDCNPPASSVHIILQASLLEWVAIPFSRGYSWPRVRNWVSHIAGSSLSLKPWGKPPEYYKAPLKISYFHPQKWIILVRSFEMLSLKTLSFFFLIKKKKLATPCGKQDLSSQTRGQTHPLFRVCADYQGRRWKLWKGSE